MDRPLISFVATTRNDNHGGDMTARMNMFVNALAKQCDRHGLDAELVLVEWNPPEERQPLAQELCWPEAGNLDIRIITVPPEVHRRYKYHDVLPLYQMIAKNVGIRRARGEYILATNVDILFSDELICWMAEEGMQRGYQYRLDRFDVEMPLPEHVDRMEPSDLLAQCRENLLRQCGRETTKNLKTGDIQHIFSLKFIARRERLHTNACGDFALAHRDHWRETNGYPEVDLFSFHIDSLWVFNAHFSGVREKFLAPPIAIYHIEHGGGFTPETLKKMDESLKERQLPRYDNGHFASMSFRACLARRPIRFNDTWGLPDDSFQETVVRQAKRNEKKAAGSSAPRISLVVTSRNDDHGENILERTQTFLDSWRQIASEEGLSSEIVFVEWNPPEDRPPLKDVLHWEKTDGVDLRFITVPDSVHNTFPNHERIPLFQMIAKNVGARRAKGQWILFTNVDVLFNRPLVRFLAHGELDREAFYRVARFDCGERLIPEHLSLDEKLRFCEENLARINLNGATVEREKLADLREIEGIAANVPDELLGQCVVNDPERRVFGNACGDFTLLHRNALDRLRGYPELPIWSIYIDGLLLHAAVGAGIRQLELVDPMRVYHIEHGRSWVVDTSEELRDHRLDYQKHYKTWCESLLKNESSPVNPVDWGLNHIELPETSMNELVEEQPRYMSVERS